MAWYGMAYQKWRRTGVLYYPLFEMPYKFYPIESVLYLPRTVNQHKSTYTYTHSHVRKHMRHLYINNNTRLSSTVSVYLLIPNLSALKSIKFKLDQIILQEMDMINLFGSPAGRAINEITSIKLNRSEQEGGKPSHLSSNSNVDKQKTNIRNEFVQLNLTKFNQSTNTNKTSTWGAVSNASLLAKKVKFWKYFEENKQKSSNGSSIAANSTAMHCNSVTRK